MAHLPIVHLRDTPCKKDKKAISRQHGNALVLNNSTLNLAQLRGDYHLSRTWPIDWPNINKQLPAEQEP